MALEKPQRIAVIGTVGVPANYGGFETMVDNLARFHAKTEAPEAMVIYCSSTAYEDHLPRFMNSDLRYIGLPANGVRSMLYDGFSMLDALRRGTDTLLVLGVSGALALPVIRAISRARVITNIDGIEWKREKWGPLQRFILKWSEAAAVRLSHDVVADNAAIAEYVEARYGKTCAVIAYGGDHAIQPDAKPVTEVELPERYAFNVCRIEPENNVHMLLEAFADRADFPLVVVGNWDRSPYGVRLKAKYAQAPGVHIIDPIYDVGKLKTLRQGASAYLHGHSAGGTNPSLVEMMFFGVPVLAYDCNFNRHTTEERASYFGTAEELSALLTGTTPEALAANGAAMKEIAERRYTWDAIGGAYFDLLRRA